MGAGLEYRRKAHREFEAKIQQVFFEAYNSVYEKQVFRKTLTEELNLRLAELSDETKSTQTLQIATCTWKWCAVLVKVLSGSTNQENTVLVHD